MRIPKIIVGATIVSLGTTTPEAAVSVLSAFRGDAGLALGNAIGSVICDTGLIFGLGCLITRLPLDRFILNRHGWLQIGAGLLLVALIGLSRVLYSSPIITRWMGAFLLLLLALYLTASVHWARSHPRVLEDMPRSDTPVLLCLAMVVGGLTVVVISSKFLIADVEAICHLFSIPQSIISATLVAFGTSLPELVTALTSIRRGHPELLVGNILGADILNILFVIGASATASPLVVPSEVLWLHIPSMLIILMLFRGFSLSRRATYRRVWGVPLLCVYAAFLILAFSFGIEAG
jgi:cation:H+ antiporter